MRRYAMSAGVVALVVCTFGCRARQLQCDQDKFRAALLDMYTNQVMDNLVRAYNGMPIVQLDYSRATGTISQQAGADLNGSQTAAAIITNFFAWRVTGQQTNQLTVTAEPVLNNNEVYNAYLEFLKPDPERGARLLVSSEPPPSGAAHITQKCGHCYYWIPAEFKYDFLRLALVTTVQRGQPLSAPAFFEVAIVRVESGVPKTGRSQLLVTFSKKIFNDTGNMLVRLGDRKYEFLLQRYNGPEDNIPGGGKTNQLLMVYGDSEVTATGLKVEDLIVQLQGEPVKVKLDHFYPTIPTTDNLLKDIRAENELQRLLLFER